MTEVLILAAALSMDAFAVSIGLGSKHEKNIRSLALMSGIYFGIFQGIMPLIGYLGGMGILGWVESYAKWIAFILLLLIGCKMIYESFSEGIEEDIVRITHKVMLILAIATSIDAMAAGFTLTLIDVNPLLACFLIGITTFLFSCLGVIIGRKTGRLVRTQS
ncbi:manganese efflux pump MntP family protein [Colwellia sp. MSW7]|uniref:Putative manganese efflux pump MntP n=1 Tax=Colwellia maritima TaxID=2912588 RepID=A0ABS9X0B3_9GAMM|nr:manganese efflux pump MntP family protein [Colwellia maritima]MCI2283599.1 manganese efflux pump MntP family protein [Colwellia maritima]